MLTSQEEDLLDIGREVKARGGRFDIDFGSPPRAVHARQQLYTLRKRMIKQALDNPDQYPPDTLDLLSCLTTQLPKGSSTLIITDGSWLDHAIAQALGRKGGNGQ